jgi:CDP-diacylglycerol---serine O-phosphatidyltransferase
MKNFRSPGIYWLPNLLTTFNLLCGLLAIILCLGPENSMFGHENGQAFSTAAWLIMAAMVFDFLDGKVARWTHTESDFGVKIDSLTDFVSFGVAPTILALSSLLPYSPWLLKIIPSCLFLLAGAWRLARFNCDTQDVSKPSSHFIGLPIPAAAACISATVLVYSPQGNSIFPTMNRSLPGIPNELMGPVIALWMLALALLMVSHIPFPAFKRIDQRNLILLLGVTVFCSMSFFIMPISQVVFLLLFLYLTFGLFQFFILRVMGQKTFAEVFKPRPLKKR